MARTSIRWLGHAMFQVVSPTEKILHVDSWVEGNPSCPIQLQDIDRADLILVTHNHFHHAGQTVQLIRQTGAALVAMVETTEALKAEGVPPERTLFEGIGMNIGGQVALDGIRVTMTQAFHSSGSGNPAGFVMQLENGATIYHAGDTAQKYYRELTQLSTRAF